jgi:antitoxin VapB
MPLNIRSREVDELAARLAKRLGTTKTEAVRRALEHELERAEPRQSLAERIRPIQERIASWPRSGLEADKAFYDSLYEE